MTQKTTKSGKNTERILAFDKSSARSYDADGRLHVSRTHISKANVCPYRGNEIPGWQELGLDENKVYRLYRDPEELAKGAKTFSNLPILRRHIYVSADDPKKEEVVGSIGSDVTFDGSKYLDASICIWDSQMIGAIESGDMQELSSAYRYKPVMEPGESPDGEQYDGRMTDIIGNHLAPVQSGRAGPDVIVADSNPFKEEIPAMKKTRLGKALLVALSAVSPKLAQDSSLSSMLGGAVKGKFNTSEAVKKLIAMDSEIDENRAKELIDAVIDVETDPVAKEPPALNPEKHDGGAPSKHAEVIDFLRAKGLSTEDLEAVGNMLTRMEGPPKAADENIMKPEDVEQKVQTAMDSLSADLRAQFKALESAKSDVRKTVGDLIGMDSAADVYRFALDHLKVEHKDTPDAGLRNLFAVAASHKAEKPRTLIAADSKTIADAIPGIERFGSI